MIRVVVEINRGAACHRLVVQSSNIRAALSIVEEHYLDGGEARVVFPIDPEPFFVREPGAAGLVEVQPAGERPSGPGSGAGGCRGGNESSARAETPRSVLSETAGSHPQENFDRPEHFRSV